MSYDVDALRRGEFAWADAGDVVYLNHAGTGPLPSRSIETLREWNGRRAQPWLLPDRTVVFPALQRTRELCATLIGAASTEIALVPNTSHGISLAARVLPFTRGDVVLTHAREFPSIVYGWTAIGRARDVILRTIPGRDGLPDEAAMLRALDDPRVRAVVVSWVGFATGFRVDLERLGAACRERGIFLIVDAIQGVGAAVLDVHACNIDILACGSQKWLLGPWGAGFLYVRADLIPSLEPPVLGWLVGAKAEDYTRMLEYDLTYYGDARRFEVMTLGAQDYAAMGRSIELLLTLGVTDVARHIQALVDRVVAWAMARRDVRLVTPAHPAQRAGIVAVAPRDSAIVSQRLNDAGVMHSLREGAIRLSPHCYNTTDDIDAALALFDEDPRK